MGNQSAGGKATAIIEKQQARERIDEYNKNPNVCKKCGKPIIAPYDKKLREIKRKQFCNKSCAASYNNKGSVKNLFGNNGTTSKIDDMSLEEIKNAYVSSNNYTDFCKKIGYSQALTSLPITLKEKLKQLNLDIEHLKDKKDSVLNLTKGELFDKRELWQNARSGIQKLARTIYEQSNKPKQCAVCGYATHYEVAHIKPVSSFTDNDYIKDINDIGNLLALCPNHHWEYDHGVLDLQNYI